MALCGDAEITTLKSMLTPGQRSVAKVAARDGWECHICHKSINPRGKKHKLPTLDHIIPRSRGGTNALDNIKLAHRLCNQKRGQQTMAEIAQARATTEYAGPGLTVNIETVEALRPGPILGLLHWLDRLLLRAWDQPHRTTRHMDWQARKENDG